MSKTKFLKEQFDEIFINENLSSNEFDLLPKLTTSNQNSPYLQDMMYYNRMKQNNTHSPFINHNTLRSPRISSYNSPGSTIFAGQTYSLSPLIENSTHSPLIYYNKKQLNTPKYKINQQNDHYNEIQYYNTNQSHTSVFTTPPQILSNKTSKAPIIGRKRKTYSNLPLNDELSQTSLSIIKSANSNLTLQDIQRRRRNTSNDFLRNRNPRMEKGRGLRQFSLRVCQKVQEKRDTTYNEVADALYEDLQAERQIDPKTGLPKKWERKNIRRRVYDALNVLMAMDIIIKDRKRITWIGLPSGIRLSKN